MHKERVLPKIPAFPPVVLRALDLLADEDVSFNKLGEVILSDAAFSATILRMANSALYGLAADVVSLPQALGVLGLEKIRSLTLTVATCSYTWSALRIEELRRCWRHTLACAILTEQIARACGFSTDRAYTAGLMHDIGRLGLLVGFPKEYSTMLKEAERDGLDVREEETERFGMDHCEAGRRLAETWKLPEELQIVTACHHEPPVTSRMDLLRIVHLGCRLADALGFDVITPVERTAFGDIRSLLPKTVQERFPDDPEVLLAILAERMPQLESGTLAPQKHASGGFPERLGVRRQPATAEPRRPIYRDPVVLAVILGFAVLLWWILRA